MTLLVDQPGSAVLHVVLIGDDVSRSTVKRLLGRAGRDLVIHEYDAGDGHLARLAEVDSTVRSQALVGHDLRGPLTNISLATDLFEKGTEDQVNLAITILRRAIAQAERLIGDLVDRG